MAHKGVASISERNLQALAWEIITADEPNIIEKYGGLNNASAYIGMMPSRKLGIVILANRGNVYPNEVGRRIMLDIVAPSSGAREEVACEDGPEVLPHSCRSLLIADICEWPDLVLGVEPTRRLVWQFGDIPNESRCSLYPLPPLSIVLSQRQQMLQSTGR